MLQEKFDISLNKIIGAAPPRAALAISGGSDSMALLYLASNWAQKGGIKLVILHVNHNLRISSKNDAQVVSKFTKKLGHEYHEQKWQFEKKPISGVQEKARAMRYELMTKKCKELGIQILMTAHHQDDLLENYLMRKKRGSSFFGLSHSESYFHENVHIVRPLLSFSKANLQDYLRQNDIFWIEDETNSKDLYERNRVRKTLSLMQNKEKQDILNEMLAANQLAEKFNQQLIDFLAEFVQIDQMGFCTLQITKYQNLSLDLQIQVISYLLTIISGKTTLPRFRNIGPLIDKIKQNERINCSLHGCQLISIDQELLICREKNKISKEYFQLKDYQIWDQRFEINNRSEVQNYQITVLSQNDYSTIKDKILLLKIDLAQKIHKNLILFTLPVIKHLEKVVAIPHISYYDEKILEDNLRIIFRPNFVSRFTHFL